MTALQSLEAQYPILDYDFQSFCASHAIFTVQDFLLHDLYELAAFAQQHPRSDALKEGIAQVLTIIDEQHHQPWLNGMGLLEDAERKHFLSTGWQGVDSLLQGGLKEGELTELVGSSSTGKTQVCLRFASNVAMQHVGAVIYIDTGNSFSSQRIEHFLRKISGSVFHQSCNRIVQNIMSNIMCHSVFDIFSMFDILHQLDINLRCQEYNKGCKMRLLIVDSISSLIAPILGGSGSQGHALMTSAGYFLKKLAHEHNIVVLVTNHMVGGEGGNPKPALGDSWKSIPHVRLLISRDRASHICSISLLKHHSLAWGKAAVFSIDD